MKPWLVAVAALACVAVLAATMLRLSPWSPSVTSTAMVPVPEPGAAPAPPVKCPRVKRFRMGKNATDNPRTNAPYPRVLLYSFEGSGNTWVRTLLEETTGAWRALAWLGTPG